MNDLSRIRTIVVVMMENRSFDHILGYLGLEPAWQRAGLEGLRESEAWRNQVANVYKGERYPPFRLTDPFSAMDADPPHERDPIALQMGRPTGNVFPMDGFVTNYAAAEGATIPRTDRSPPVMGYFTGKEAPVTDFLARHFTVCDHWFASLPAGTQPNRLMAMSGYTTIDVNQVPLPTQKLVYDWLTERGVSWRVYHQEMPFFAMMPTWLPDILGEGHFRPLRQLYEDVENEPLHKFPQVLFIEPAYTDAPHIGPSCDDHAPSAINGGQQFLLEVYRSIARVPDIWKGAVMVVTYDEHGGFFDHVSPPQLQTDPPRGAKYRRGFETLGLRVPGLVISPFVQPRSVFHGLLDHMSILKLIGQRFDENGSYSAPVDQRAVGSVRDVLDDEMDQPLAPQPPSINDYLARDVPMVGFAPESHAVTPIQRAFQDAIEQIRQHPGGPPAKFMDLLKAFPSGTKGVRE